MRHGPLVFLAAFFALSLSWFGFVLTPQVQIGRPAQETNSVAKGDLYPNDRPGIARQGLEVYRANGCVYCHSQQVEQKGTLVDVLLTDAGKNTVDVANLLDEQHLGNFNGPSVGAGLPKAILTNATIDAATVLAKNLKTAGATTKLRLVPTGPDIERGWGTRRNVAQDFAADATAMPGLLRVGPDLSNEGERPHDLNWQYVHLYNPGAVSPKSPMPDYKFLFERKKKRNGGQDSPDALKAAGTFSPDKDYEIIPKPEAKALVAYLASLSSDTPLYEAPVTPPPAPATNAPATNAPTK